MKKVTISALVVMAENLILLDKSHSIKTAVNACAKLAGVKDAKIVDAAVKRIVADWTSSR